MSIYFFQLGREPEISIAEITAVFSLFSIPFTTKEVAKTHLLVETENTIDASAFMNRLGGTIAIGEYLEPKETIVATLIAYLLQHQGGTKITFSLFGDNALALAKAVKKELKEQGESVRFVEQKNTATILHNNLVPKHGHFTVLGKRVFATLAIQDIEEFTKRDYGRPNTDAKSGMLPPKLARMMINLAEQPLDATILDPFCGSGTILTEAAAIGYHSIIGSDASGAAVNDTKKNLTWLKSTTHNVFVSDVRKLNSVLSPKTIDAIVSEPYLGKPLRRNELRGTLQKQAEELATLYLESFKVFHTLLRKDGIVVFIIPEFQHQGDTISVRCIDEIKKIGFEPIPLSEKNTSLRYFRETQHLARIIWKFKKK